MAVLRRQYTIAFVIDWRTENEATTRLLLHPTRRAARLRLYPTLQDARHDFFCNILAVVLLPGL